MSGRFNRILNKISFSFIEPYLYIKRTVDELPHNIKNDDTDIFLSGIFIFKQPGVEVQIFMIQLFNDVLF